MAANHPSDPTPIETTAQPGGGAIDRLRNLSAITRTSVYTTAYSRGVRWLRIVLPITGVLAVIIVIMWPRIRAEFNHPTETTPEERQARMINGRYVGSDSHGRPYTVTYDSAQQPPGGGPIDMVNPTAELTLGNGHWVAIKADHGLYDQAGGLLDLSGDVELFHDEGYHFTTERAHVEFNKNLTWGDRAITGRGPKGEVAGRGFRIINNGDAIVVTGPAKLLLRPDAAEMAPPEGGKAPGSKR